MFSVFISMHELYHKRAMIIAVHVPVAQLDRVLASEAEGCEFEPHRAHHIKTHQLITADVFLVCLYLIFFIFTMCTQTIKECLALLILGVIYGSALFNGMG